MTAFARRTLQGFRALFTRGARVSWPSETSKCRARLAPFCAGCGLDVGFGGDAIAAHAIRLDRAKPYANVGRLPVQLVADGTCLPVRDGTLDFVYSSHLLEDFADTESVLCEWMRVLKPGGRLVLYCPDEQRYRTHCRLTGQPYNQNHQHDDFCLAFVKAVLDRIGGVRVIHEAALVDEYSWEAVVVKAV